MRTFYNSHKEIVDKILLFSMTLLTVFIFFKYLFVYVAPFFVGLCIALVMEPVIKLLTQRLKFKRWLASALCLVLFMMAVGVLGTLIVSNVMTQLTAFMEASPQYVEEISRKLDEANDWLWNLMDRMPASINTEYTEIQETLMNSLGAIFGDGVRDQSIKLVSNVPDFFLGFILAMVSAFFFMKDRAKILAVVVKLCPGWIARNLRLIRRGLQHAAAGYFRAQFILMSIVGIISITGLLILGNPYALLIGLVMAMLDFLPVAGSGAVLLPWTIFNLATGQYTMAIGLLVLYAIITVTRQVLEPKILGEQIGLHPLITLMSMYSGFRVFGFFGILLGPSLMVIGKAVLEAERLGDADPPPKPLGRAKKKTTL